MVTCFPSPISKKLCKVREIGFKSNSFESYKVDLIALTLSVNNVLLYVEIGYVVSVNAMYYIESSSV